MPSWSPSDPPENAATHAATAAETAVERVRRLLEQLFGGRVRDEDDTLQRHER